MSSRRERKGLFINVSKSWAVETEAADDNKASTESTRGLRADRVVITMEVQSTNTHSVYRLDY